ncbi:MAG: bifunctional riboflavin kinase/FAD synthetase [Spirochaetia bacterium]|nr:bifunctional riboflavin kinase/FAD synthetase [Spirochaetia bacterium]
MHIIHDIENFEAPWKSCAVTPGVFDGLHKGHQALIHKLLKKRVDARVLLTYHPHPDLVLGKRKSAETYELFTYEEKLALFQSYPLDAVVFLPFTPELARMTALRYLKEILLGKLKASHIVIGYDQCFGRGRKGDFAFLKKMSRRYNYSVDRVKAVRRSGLVISSSQIRNSLANGQMETAAKLLGHDYFITGLVVRGFQRGREMGFPTANLEVPRSKVLPMQGVYTARAEWGGRSYRAMVNIGTNPTFDGRQLTIEANLLDFNADLYGEQLRIHFRKRIRDEVKFDSMEALIAQLHKDREVTLKEKL